MDELTTILAQEVGVDPDQIEEAGDAEPEGRPGQYVFLRADGLRLIVPQGEIGDIEHLDSVPQPGGAPGLLSVPGQDEVCFLALSEGGTLLDACPEDRFVSTRITSPEGVETQWCWTEARVLLDFAPEFHDIPAILLNAASPIRQYVLMEEQPVYVCSARTLQHLFLGGA